MAKEKKTVCTSCNKEYDILLSRCPCCHSPNENRPETRMTFLPIPHQVSLFLVGLLGFNLIAIVAGIIVSFSFKDQPALSSLVINTISYSLLVIIDLILVFKYFPELFSSFRMGRTYIAGIIGFAIIYGGTILINIIMHALVPSAGTGGNQSVAEEMILTNPILCLFIVGLFGPFAEELTYRVGLFSLCKRASTVLAYALTILIFAFIHFNFTSKNIVNEFVALPDYLFAGIIFSLLYHREGFGAALIAHTGNNLLSILLIVISKRIGI